MLNKFNAKAIWADLDTLETSLTKSSRHVTYFASHLEFETYRLLRRFYSQKNILRQYKVLIKPETKRFSEVLWRVDFAIVDDMSNLLFLIESKGFLTDDFKLKLSFLEYRQPNFYNKLILVSNHATVLNREISTISLQDLQQRLINYALVSQQKTK